MDIWKYFFSTLLLITYTSIFETTSIQKILYMGFLLYIVNIFMEHQANGILVKSVRSN